MELLYLVPLYSNFVVVVFYLLSAQSCPPCRHVRHLQAVLGLFLVNIRVQTLRRANPCQLALCSNPALSRDQALTMTISIVFQLNSRLVLATIPREERFKCH